MILRGVNGRIEWGSIPAAQLDGYTVGRTLEGAWTLEASIRTIENLYALRHGAGALELVVPVSYHGHRRPPWRWPITSSTLTLNPPRLSATLGPPATEAA